MEVRLRGAVSREVLAKVTANIAFDVSFEATQEALANITDYRSGEICIDTPDYVVGNLLKLYFSSLLLFCVFLSLCLFVSPLVWLDELFIVCFLFFCMSRHYNFLKLAFDVIIMLVLHCA